MDPDSRAAPVVTAAGTVSGSARALADPAAAVAALYREHALSLIRLAYIMLGDRPAAEDVVHDAFCGLYRRWEHVANKASALGYVRSSVLNGCRSALRRGRTRDLALTRETAIAVASAEAELLSREERREVVSAMRLLPGRQREVLVLRFYLDLPDEQIAQDMGISPSTVRSARRRALASLARSLKEMP